MTQTIKATSILLPLLLSCTQQQTLPARYMQNCDLFSETERLRLRFVRWLYESGRLVP
jgi:hypothetical protein